MQRGQKLVKESQKSCREHPKGEEGWGTGNSVLQGMQGGAKQNPAKSNEQALHG